MVKAAGGIISIDDMDKNTGWIDCPLSGGTSTSGSFTMQAKQVGDRVYIEGRLTRASGVAQQLWFTIPSGISLPRRTVTLNCASNNASSLWVYIDSAGGVRTNIASASSMSLHLNDGYTI